MKVKNYHNILMQLRKVCNHPFLVSNVEASLTKGMSSVEAREMLLSSSGKLIFLDKLLVRLAPAQRRIACSTTPLAAHVLRSFSFKFA